MANKYAVIDVRKPRGYAEGSDDSVLTDGLGNLNVNIANGTINATSAAQYSSTPPTMTSGQSGPLQCDINGALKVSGSINASSSAIANTGTPATVSNGSSNALQADGRGSLLVQQRDANGATLGVLANPLRTDTTGTTTQPVSGTVAVSNFPGTQPVSIAATVATKAVAPTLNVGQVSIGTTATQILAANANRTRLLVTNLGTTDVFLGGSGVTVANGHSLKGIAGYPVALRFTGAVYGIVSSGTQSISYAEETN